ncbi:MAG: hypothetical protein EA360_06980 [Balneolaceae bacterium]|nr:MAG: hypothetical protein EA360_06980 [Balneolaceae bacterium]
MKTSLLLWITILLLTSMGCATVGQQTSGGMTIQNELPDGAVTDHMNYFRSLADYLYRIPGVNVTGPSNNPTVTIRGINSFNSGIEPLYVIDGQPAGTSYSQVNNMLNIKDIAYVRVLKGSEASYYGVRGGNGVIIITTKR